MYEIQDKEVAIEGGWNHRYGLWYIIIQSYTKNKTSVQTKNYTTVASNASLYAKNPKYERQQILSMTVHGPACTQQSPTSTIQ